MAFFGLFKSKSKRNASKVVSVAGVGMPNMSDLQALKMGIQRSCVIKLKCGACSDEWQDAVEPQKTMQVVCPHCGAKNHVTFNLNIY